MKSRVLTPFGVLLKHYRAAAMLTQEQLAARARLSADTIRALESGKRRAPRAATLHLIIDALGLADADRAALLDAASLQTGTPPTPDSADPPGARGAATPEMTAARAVAPARRFGWPDANQPTPLLGRANELALIRQRLTGDGLARDPFLERTRLLTLTGPAGVGKTRLALAASVDLATRFPDGVAWVDLAPIRDPLLTLPTIAQALGISDAGGQPIAVRLRDFLRERSLLLTLDNLEQVTSAAAALAELLAACPGIAMLVTSRVPLRLRWESIIRIAPLATPDPTAPLPPLNALAQEPAIALFVARACARRADFALTPTTAPLVARIVAALDGLPLAIELAAAGMDALPLAMIADWLGERLRPLHWAAADLPERQQSLDAAIGWSYDWLGERLRPLHWAAADLPERQQSLDAAIGWSYDLLGESEQRVFRRLGVFSGRVALPAITSMLSATTPDEARADVMDEMSVLETLASLVEKSLALTAADDADGAEGAAPHDARPTPAFTLLETAREYAWEQLARTGELAAAQRAHARYFLALAEQADPHLRSHAQLTWYTHLEREHNNMRAALRWLLAGDDETGADAESARERGEMGLRLATALGWFWWTRGYIVEGWRWLEAALNHAPTANAALRAKALVASGKLLAYQGEFDRAQHLLEEALALAQQHAAPDDIAQVFSALGLCAVYAGDAATATPWLHEALRRGEALGDTHLRGMTQMYLGAAAVAQGHDEQALAIYKDSLAHLTAAGDRLFVVNLQLNLGWFAWRRGELYEAVTSARAGAHMSAASGNRRLLSFSAQMALLLDGASDVGDQAYLARQARLLGVIDAMNQTTGMTLLQTVVRASLVGLRERLERQPRFAVAYREGNTLTIQASAALVLATLDEIMRARSIAPVTRTIASNYG